MAPQPGAWVSSDSSVMVLSLWANGQAQRPRPPGELWVGENLPVAGA
jgi:hypothetical protein